MELRIFLIGIMLNILDLFLRPLFWLRSRRKKIVLPPVDDPVLLISATNLAIQIRKRKISSEKVVKAYIKRIRIVNPIINAVVEDRFVAAVEDARLVDTCIADKAFLEEEAERNTPLLGVPVTVKGSCAVAGLSHAVGSLTRLSVKANRDSESVRRLKAAGAIPLLVSNTPELCLSWECDNLVTGATCNPYNTNHTSGGSSGGEGALLGAAASVIGLGSDIAGSIRLPAMFNGVFGHKSTPGVVPLEGHYPLSSDERFSEYLAIGPLARFATDLQLLMKVLAANMSQTIGLYNKVDLSTLTVYFMEEVPKYPVVIIPVQQEIKTAIKEAVKYLEAVCKSNISDFKFEEMNASCEICLTHYFTLEDVPNIFQTHCKSERTPNFFIEIIKSIFGMSVFYRDSLFYYALQSANIFVLKKRLQKYKNACKALKETFLEQLGSTGVFLYPTFPTSAFLHGELITKSSGVIYPMIFNILGFPSTNIPVGFDKKGMPIGLQVVAAPNQDRLCLAVAEVLETCFGGWVERPH